MERLVSNNDGRDCRQGQAGVAHALETSALQKLYTVTRWKRNNMTLEQFAQFIREGTTNGPAD